MADLIQRTTAAKALRINLDAERYGAFAEIGAGQEVARHFFVAGKASQTIAKSMSAYDMTYSDEIYGREKNGRYVCESRVQKMLEKEYSLLLRRLDEQRGAKTCFFAYANTVATGTPESPRCHGWMGVRFQTKPRGPFNDVILHVRMMDRHRLQQQDALGVLGVNLIDAAFYNLKKPEDFLDVLTENIKEGQIIIDVLKFSGPDVAHFDNRRISLELVRRGLAEAVLFSPDKEILHISDAVYGKGLLIQRGEYQPVTVTHVDVLKKGIKQLQAEMPKGEKKSETLPLMEIVMPREMKAKDLAEIESRLNVLASCGLHALVSNFTLFYQLKRFFRKNTQLPMAIVLGASKLERLFNEKHYQDLEGGLLEGLGKLFDEQTKIYVYPHKTDKECLTSKSFRPKGSVAGIYDLFQSKGQIVDIAGCDEAGMYWHSEQVRTLMQKKDKSWEKLVPSEALSLIRKGE